MDRLSTQQFSVGTSHKKAKKNKIILDYTDKLEQRRDFEFRCEFDATEQPEETGPIDADKTTTSKFDIMTEKLV